MSENHPRPQVERLSELLRLLLSGAGADVRTLWQASEAEMEALEAKDILHSFAALSEEGHTPQELMPIVDKAVNLVRDYMPTVETLTDEPLPYWMAKLEANNDEILSVFDELRQCLTQGRVGSELDEQVQAAIETLKSFEAHYQFKENVLFSLLERRDPVYRGLQLMWGKHDEAREALKQLEQHWLDEEQTSEQPARHAAKVLGNVFFRWQGMVEKERAILFPAALATLDANDHRTLNAAIRGEDKHASLANGTINLAELQLLTNHLPGEFTWVDENDKVRYYSEGGQAIFPRTPQVIGRDVRQCHPPDSVDTVEEIIAAFRAGQQDEANFWLDRRGQFILIRYRAVRDTDDTYRGVLEYTEEISGLRALEGERRLLDWDS